MIAYNEANKKGGIHGRKLVIVSEDDKCTGTDLVAAVKKLVTMDEVFILNGGSCSSAIVSAQEYVERVQVPLIMLNASGDQSLYPPVKYIYGGLSITQRAVGGSAIEFAVTYLKAKRIAWIAHTDAYGGWNIEAATYQLKNKHPQASFATVERVERELTDAMAIALKVKNSNPDVVVLAAYDRPSAILQKALYDLGVKVPYVLLATGSSNVFQTFKAVGAKEAFKDFYFQDCVKYGPDGKPGPEWARKLYTQYYPDMAKLPEYPMPWMFQGISIGMLVCKVLQDAGPEPTREKVLKALENTTYYDPGLHAGPFKFGPADHAGQESAIYLKFDGEKTTPIPGSYESIWKWEGKK
jgi:branched-chain amino acid transport system substrate-binding protein